MVLVSDKTDRRVWGTCAGLTRVSDSLSESALILSWPGLTLLLPFLLSPRPLLSRDKMHRRRHDSFIKYFLRLSDYFYSFTDHIKESCGCPMLTVAYDFAFLDY